MARSRVGNVIVGVAVAAVFVAGGAPAVAANGSATGAAARSSATVVPAVAGARLWKRRYNGPGNSDDGATSVAVSGDGATVFVTGGGSGLTGGYSYTTLAYDASTGAPHWSSTYDGPSHGYDQATSIGLSPDGSKVFITGASRGTGTSLDFATVAYDASNGHELWVKRYSGPGKHVDYATALGVSADGAIVVVTGLSPGLGHRDDYVTLGYNASTGATLWTKRYDGPGHGNDDARALAVSPGGSTVVVTGSSVGATGDPDYFTVAYNATTGAKVWGARYNGPGNDVDEAQAVKVSADGSKVFVTGNSFGAIGFDYGTVAYNASTGGQLWARHYSGSAHRDDYGTAVAVSPDGSAVYVTGFATGVANRFDYGTVAYNPSTGAKLWAKSYNGPASDTDDANAVAVSPDSSTVVVTGASAGADHSIDYATVAYDATNTGAQLWVKRFNGAAHNHDFAYALAMRPDGSAVYVTGESTAANGFLDFATIAYSLH